MRTGQIGAEFVNRVLAGYQDFGRHGIDAMEQALWYAIDAFLGTDGVMGTVCTPVYAAGPPDTLSLPAASTDFFVGGKHLHIEAGAMEGCTSMGFHHDGATTYYLGMRWNEHPSNGAGPDWGVRQGRSSANFFAYTSMDKSIGEVGNPDLVTYAAGVLYLRVDTLAKSIWTDAGSRDCVVWLDTPVTAGASAIETGTVVTDGAGHVHIVCAGTFGQGTTPSTTVTDYNVLIKGATITTVNISASDDYCYLGTFNCATNAIDTSAQNVISAPGLSALDLWQLAQDLYPVDNPAPSLDGDGVANLVPSLGNRSRIHGQQFASIWGNQQAGGFDHGFGRIGGIGIKLNTNKAGYQAFNPVAGLTEALGVVNVALSQNVIVSGEIILTEGTPCTRHFGLNDWTNYDYTPAADGFYCVYFDAVSVSYNLANCGHFVDLNTKVQGAAASVAAAINLTELEGLLPVYGYEISGGAMVVGTKTRCRLEEYTGIGSFDGISCQYEEREICINISDSRLVNTATTVLNAPPTVNIELSYPAAADYTLTPISLPAGYEIVQVEVDADANIGGGAATSTMRARICDTSGALSADATWADGDGRATKTITPTLGTHDMDAPGGLVWLEIEKDAKGAGDGDGRVYDVIVTYARYLA